MLSPKVMSMTPINFITEIIDKNPIGNQTPKSPMRPPLVYIEDHTGAQEKSLFSKFNLEVKALFGIKQHGMTPLNLNAQLSYGIIDRLSLLVSAEKQWSLFNIDGSKWYANSTLLGIGCDSDWAVHYMENPVTTLTHNLHGSTLAIISVAWMRYCYGRDLPKAVNFARRVMDVAPQATDEQTAIKGIDALEEFLREMGLPVRLSEIGIKPDLFPVLADRALQTAGSERVGGVSLLTRDEVMEIYKLAE